ncbi:TetR/AcrR family transcriptional regulator [Persicobacter diffluens]|uniref:TetR family transcriptional regulator n=1 Tax=Persicobacter diffluens TaxID=981 RepID=A0AAN4VXY9_9BACT|nr:TetR family transcriptional regulator [Persicobacter diffluens]
MQDRIIELAYDLFSRIGIRSVTMDEIARPLGISKKTLYQFFPNKEALLTAALDQELKKQELLIEETIREADNAVEAFYNISEYVRNMHSQTNPIVIFEMERYYPKVFEHYLSFKKHCISHSIADFFRQGMKEGYFREDLDPQIIAKLRMEQFEYIFKPDIFPRAEFEYNHVCDQLFDHFMHGILTGQGRKIYQELKNNTENHNNKS